MRESADVEEQRHDLEQPGHDPQARHELQRAGGARAGVGPLDDGEGQMGQHDDGQRADAQQVKVAVAGGSHAALRGASMMAAIPRRAAVPGTK